MARSIPEPAPPVLRTATKPAAGAGRGTAHPPGRRAARGCKCWPLLPLWTTLQRWTRDTGGDPPLHDQGIQAVRAGDGDRPRSGHRARRRQQQRQVDHPGGADAVPVLRRDHAPGQRQRPRQRAQRPDRARAAVGEPRSVRRPPGCGTDRPVAERTYQLRQETAVHRAPRGVRQRCRDRLHVEAQLQPVQHIPAVQRRRSR